MNNSYGTHSAMTHDSNHQRMLPFDAIGAAKTIIVKAMTNRDPVSVIICVYEKAVVGVGQPLHILWAITGASQGLSKIEQRKLCSILLSY